MPGASLRLWNRRTVRRQPAIRGLGDSPGVKLGEFLLRLLLQARRNDESSGPPPWFHIIQLRTQNLRIAYGTELRPKTLPSHLTYLASVGAIHAAIII